MSTAGAGGPVCPFRLIVQADWAPGIQVLGCVLGRHMGSWAGCMWVKPNAATSLGHGETGHLATAASCNPLQRRTL